MGKYVKLAACLGILLALPVAASAATVNIGVTDANGDLVNNAAVSFNGAKGLPSASGLWTASVPYGKLLIVVEHPAVGTQLVEVLIDADNMYVIARVVNGQIAVSTVSGSAWPGATTGSLTAAGQPVNLPGPTDVTGFLASGVDNGSATAAGSCGGVYPVTQNVDPDTIEALAGIACSGGGLATENAFARLFDLSTGATAGIPLTLKCVEFGVETWSPLDGTSSVDVTINVYDGVGFPSRPSGTLLGSKVVTVAAGAAPAFFIADFSADNVLIPANATLTVEAWIPNLQDGVAAPAGGYWPGTNNAGQTAPSYIWAPDCGATTYTDISLLGPFPTNSWVYTVEFDPQGDVFGACCDDATGSCTDNVLSTDCTGRFAANTACIDLDPYCGNEGACCYADGSCTDSIFQAACEAGGGTYQGDATNCGSVSCPQPPDGACCHLDGTCTIANEFTCDGTFQGGGSVCDPNPCPQGFNCTNTGGQLPDQNGGGSGTLAGTSDTNAGYALAENFTAIADGTVSSACIWGLHLLYNAGWSPCTPTEPDAFQVTIYADDAGGTIPGSVLAGPFAATGQSFPTGLDVAGFPEWGAMISFPAVNVTADTCYWIEIVNVNSTTCWWLWEAAAPGDGRSAQDNAGYAPTTYDLSLSMDIDFDTSACILPDPCEGATGDCCSANGSAGCEDSVCCNSVCSYDSYCCETDWDSFCAGEAASDPNCPQCNPTVPPNDLCDDAIAVTVGSTTAGTTAGATIDSQVGTCGTSTTSPGVWYSVVGTGNTMTADLCNGATSYDSKLTVVCQDCAVPTCVDGNDDSCGLQSSVTWCSQANATYLILVHGYGGSTGSFELTVTDSGSGCNPTVFCLPPDPTGACCYQDTTCDIQTEADCTAAGGLWQGEDTECFVLSGNPSTYSSAPGVAIPDATPGGVSDVISVGDSYAIGDVNVTLNVSHTWVGDLCAILEHGGTTATLIQRIGDTGGLACDASGCCGNSGDNLDVILDDEATAPINDATEPFTGSYTPEQPLGAFDGAEVNGDWTMTVVDNAGGDTGTLNSWSLVIDTGDTICAVCGNGIVEPGEDCDGGDCCTVDCTFAAAGTECRAAAGNCDIAESCSGDSADCPADAKSTDVCRPAAGDCDIAESCDGVSDNCPADAKSTAVCRPSTGACDPLESCDGVGNDCPADFVIVDCSGDTVDGCCAPGCNANNDADCVPICGNGVQEEGEECDDGNTDETDSCTFDCHSRQPVPTVSQWGLVILALLILAAAKVYFSRRQATA